MPTFYKSIPESIQSWILQQPVFYISSAPTHGKHVNISPKGHPARTLKILNPNKVIYLDSTGSGCETISHLYENGRATLMLNSFGSTPRILRLFCTGTVAERGTPAFETLVSHFQAAAEQQQEEEEEKEKDEKDWQRDALLAGARAVIVLNVFKVQTSCGFGVPKLCPVQDVNSDSDDSAAHWVDRDTLPKWAGSKSRAGEINAYRVKNNVRSLDGLPGLRSARREYGEWRVVVEVWAWMKRIVAQQGDSFVLGVLASLVVLWLLKTFAGVVAI